MTAPTDDQFDYFLPENHVEKREGLSEILRAEIFSGQIIEVQRHAWQGDPRLVGEPAFWLQIHHGLLKGSDQLVRWSSSFLEIDDVERLSHMGTRLSRLGQQMSDHAHQHHHIEDHHFFPVFLNAFAQLDHGMQLLDGDHQILGIVLDELDDAVRALLHSTQPSAQEGKSIAQQKDLLLKNGEKMLAASTRLDKLFRRHINDEEEICIPVMFAI